MPYKKLHIEIRNRVAYLLLDGGSRFNKLSVTTIREVKRAMAQLEDDPDASVIVISGYPCESFAVGADIGQMSHFAPQDAFRFAELGQSLFNQIESSKKPVIAALNGFTMGGGCDLALACDIRIAMDTLRIAHPGAKLGIITGFCGTQKLPRLVGKNIAREIFMTSETYDAAEALRMGLVDRVYPKEPFWAEVTAFAEKTAAHSGTALAAAKQLINLAEDVDLKSGCNIEAAFAGLTNCENTSIDSITQETCNNP